MKTRLEPAVLRGAGQAPPPPTPGQVLEAAPPSIGPSLRDRNRQPGTSTSDLDNLLISTKLAMVLLDRQKCILRYTPAATALFSLLPGDVGRPIRDLLPKFRDPTFLSDALLVVTGGEPSQKEVMSDDGRWYLRQTLPYCLDDGSVEGAVVIFSDVAAEALQEARLYAESIANTVREPLLVLDGKLRVRSVNEAFSRLFQVPIDEIRGCPLGEVGNGEWNLPALLSLLENVVAGSTAMEDFELPYDSGRLGERQLVLNARILRCVDGRPDLVLVSADDVTERRRIEVQLRENEDHRREQERMQRRQAELSDALRVSTVGELATGLAHELNQPLSSISNIVEACAHYVRSGTAGSPKLLTLFSEIADQAQRAAAIVAHLRSFVERGEPQLESVDLGEVVANVPRLMLRELERARVTLHVDLPPRRLPVLADRIQIEQVVVNLLQNAIDSIEESDGPRRRIELGVHAAAGMGEVHVLDTGTGVVAPADKRMFDAFFSTKTQGLGIGLSLSRSILEAHHGRIWMEAPPDGSAGAVVRFRIPRKQAARSRRGVAA